MVSAISRRCTHRDKSNSMHVVTNARCADAAAMQQAKAENESGRRERKTKTAELLLRRLVVSPALSSSATAAARLPATGWRARVRRLRSTGESKAPGCWLLPDSDRQGRGSKRRSAAR